MRRAAAARGHAMEKRGPKIGDAVSLWNFTPSPGWSQQESLVLKLCLQKYGVGQWIQIQATGLLPGKMINQLCGATQRLLGQQSLAAFSGLRVDVDRVRADNAAKVDTHRKNGLVIWSGANPTKQMRLQWQQEAKDKYSLTPEQEAEADAAVEELCAAKQGAQQPPQQPLLPAAVAGTGEALPPGINILECDAQQLSTLQKQLLLCALHHQLHSCISQTLLQHPELAGLITYQQQSQQGWLVQQQQGQQPSAADSCGGNAAISVLSDRNSHPSMANVFVGQAGRQAKLNSRSIKSSNIAASKPSSQKRSRPRAAVEDADADLDKEAAYLQRQQQRGSSSRCRSSRQKQKQQQKQHGSTACKEQDEFLHMAFEAAVNQLIEMGYSRPKAVDALNECNNDVELAVEYLTVTCC